MVAAELGARPYRREIRGRARLGEALAPDRSARKFCPLLEGLVLGTARHYGQTLEIAETACMHHGAPTCRFEIQIKHV